ncbi:FtsB family cell division protein [Chondrinema litorale]|uniref:FtsB family cell division protein n=1 Tax=Chondrinema litorale TaxID=2994555 RepID=UPI002543E258|nr:septum formation initiator family protein [Chondrinema litorale]UZR94913.1 septum formation initiator family protein [Chondrinema litorale]
MQEQPFLQKILKIVTNIYFLTGVTFLIWMLFFDSNSVMSNYKKNQKIEDLKLEEAYYQNQILEIEENMNELSSSAKQLEKFAREKYMFKKKGEDIYLIEE